MWIRFIRKLKIVVFQHKFFHFTWFNLRYFIWFPIIQCLSMCLQDSLIWYTWIKTNHVCCNQKSILWYSIYVLWTKLPVSLIYDCPSWIIDLGWWFKNLETFSLGVLQFQITGLLATSSNILWILRSKYIFIYIYIKYLYIYIYIYI